MKGDSPLITLPVAAVIGTVIMVGMPVISRMQPKKPDDPWVQLRPPTAEAGGQVLHNGRPIKGAVVSFVSTFEDPHRTYTATGVTNSEGRFLLNTFRGQIGAPVGPQLVSVQYMLPTGRFYQDPTYVDDPDDPFYYEDPGIPEMASGIPRFYSNIETSGLTATVTADGPNQFVFQLVGDAEPPDPRDNPYFEGHWEDPEDLDGQDNAAAAAAEQENDIGQESLADPSSSADHLPEAN